VSPKNHFNRKLTNFLLLKHSPKRHFKQENALSTRILFWYPEAFFHSLIPLGQPPKRVGTPRAKFLSSNPSSSFICKQ
jgi:hypothetical protein